MNSDPRITAWALGELPLEEREALQARLMIDTDLRTEAKAAQDFCRFITSQLHDEAAALTDDQRSYITAAAAPASGICRRVEPEAAASLKSAKPKRNHDSWLRQNPLVIPLAAAATLIFGSVYYVYFDDTSSATSQKPVLSSLPAKPYYSIEDMKGEVARENPSSTSSLQANPSPSAASLAVSASQPSSSNGPSADQFLAPTSPARRSISASPRTGSDVAGPQHSPRTETMARSGEPASVIASGSRKEIAGSPQAAKQETAAASANLAAAAASPPIGQRADKAGFAKQVAGPVMPAAAHKLNAVPLSRSFSDSLADIDRQLSSEAIPPRETIRLQDLLRAFGFSYELPRQAGQPVSMRIDFAETPWQPGGRLARIVIQAAGDSEIRDLTTMVSADPASAASCRILGSEDPAMLKTDRIEPGGFITLLCEIIPSSAAKPAAITVRTRRRSPPDATDIHLSATDNRRSLADADADFKFAAALAAFAIKLGDPARGPAIEWEKTLQLAKQGAAGGKDRDVLVRMIEKAKAIK